MVIGCFQTRPFGSRQLTAAHRDVPSDSVVQDIWQLCVAETGAGEIRQPAAEAGSEGAEPLQLRPLLGVAAPADVGLARKDVSEERALLKRIGEVVVVGAHRGQRRRRAQQADLNVVARLVGERRQAGRDLLLARAIALSLAPLGRQAQQPLELHFVAGRSHWRLQLLIRAQRAARGVLPEHRLLRREPKIRRAVGGGMVHCPCLRDAVIPAKAAAIPSVSAARCDVDFMAFSPWWRGRPSYFRVAIAVASGFDGSIPLAVQIPTKLVRPLAEVPGRPFGGARPLIRSGR